MYQSGKKSEQKHRAQLTNKKEFKMPQTSFVRAFQKVATDMHVHFKKTLFTILWASAPEHIAASFYSGFAVGDT